MSGSRKEFELCHISAFIEAEEMKGEEESVRMLLKINAISGQITQNSFDIVGLGKKKHWHEWFVLHLPDLEQKPGRRGKLNAKLLNIQKVSLKVPKVQKAHSYWLRQRQRKHNIFFLQEWLTLVSVELFTWRPAAKAMVKVSSSIGLYAQLWRQRQRHSFLCLCRSQYERVS